MNSDQNHEIEIMDIVNTDAFRSARDEMLELLARFDGSTSCSDFVLGRMAGESRNQEHLVYGMRTAVMEGEHFGIEPRGWVLDSFIPSLFCPGQYGIDQARILAQSNFQNILSTKTN